MDFFTNSEVEDESVPINVTSLVDVVFLLLIFFMVSTTFADSSGINIRLPKAATKEADKSESKDITVTLDKGGNVFLNSKAAEAESLKEKFLTLRQFAPGEVKLVIRADENTAHGRVVSVMDAAKQAGIDRIVISAAEKIK